MGGKRANGEGSVHKRPDGRWQAVVTLPTGKRKYYYAKTQAEASAARTRALHDLAQGLPIVAEQLTVERWLTRWLDMATPNLAPRSAARYRSLARRILMPAIGRIRLAKLSAQHIEAVYAQQLASGAAPASVRQLHAVLRRAIGEAQRLGLVQRNVAALVHAPKVPRHEMTVLLPDQAQRLLTTVRGERLEALYVLALTTGMRQGELLALRWRDVDLHECALHVQATLRYENADRYYLDPPKTPKSRRHISLSAPAVDALRQHRARQIAERLAVGPAWRDEDLVFTTLIGGALCGRVVTLGELPRLLAQAGLPRIRFHDLRHTAATLLLRAGVHPKVVSELLGHATIAMTLDRYSHVAPDMQQAAVDAMDRLFG